MNDRIYISIPVNKLAGIVTQESHSDEITHGNYNKKAYMSLSKPPVISFLGNRHMDLTGKSFGKLTVIGLFVKQTQGKKLKWVVQCKCGYYTIRQGNIIRRRLESNAYDECHKCQYTTRLGLGLIP